MTPYHSQNGIDIYHGDCLEVLPSLDAESVQCCVTSPPYWGLRDYGTATWEGGDEDCDHAPVVDEDRTQREKKNLVRNDEAGLFAYPSGWSGGGRAANVGTPTCPKCGARRIDSQLGLEATPEEYVENMVAVFREVRRVLRDDGTLWLNLGDTYNSGPCGGRDPDRWPKQSRNNHITKKARDVILKHKDLVGIPWRVAFALQADGWYLRQDIIWHKPNPMPESVTDRCTKAHEYIFLLSKQARYFYDAEAIKEPATYAGQSRGGSTNRYEQNASGMDNKEYDTRNKRSVWTVNTKSFKAAHFATFPPKLIEPCILAGCPEGGVVLDPFHGAGTTGMVAQDNGRKYVGCELNSEYIEMSKTRLQQRSLF